MPSRELATEALPEAIVDLYPYDGGYSVMGVDAESAVGLLGLLLFIDLMRVLSSRLSNAHFSRFSFDLCCRM